MQPSRLLFRATKLTKPNIVNTSTISLTLNLQTHHPRSFTSTRCTMAATEYKLKNLSSLSSLSLQPGEKQEVEVEGVEGGKVLFVNSCGSVQALGSKCTHYGAPLAKGILTSDGRLTCPWHGACFNAKTGDVEDAPALDNLPVYKVAERDGAVYVATDGDTLKAPRRKPNFKCLAPGDAQDRIVIVGGGSGTLGAVEGLRHGGYRGAITIISKEGYLPIDRPKLSKALITDANALQWRDKAWYESGSVKWVDDEVTDVDFGSQNVSTKSGEKHAYGRLILATGGTPRVLPLQGFKVLENIFTLRTIHDTKKIVEAIGENKGKKIVVIGSSFIGMEFAGATAKDNSVTVVGMEKVPLEMVLGEQIGAGIQKAAEKNGVKFHLSASVDKAESSTSDPAKVGAVFLKDGTRLEADLVVLGVGVAPATDFLKDNKAIHLEADGSIKTDENFLVTGLKDVYAVGDIATFPYHGPGGDGRPTRIEHWDVAQNAGRVVSRNIINPAVKPEIPIPVFWSALGVQLRYCGNTVGGFDDVVIQGSAHDLSFIAFYTKGETVVAVGTMDKEKDPAMALSAQLMRARKMPSKTDLLNGVDVRSISPP